MNTFEAITVARKALCDLGGIARRPIAGTGRMTMEAIDPNDMDAVDRASAFNQLGIAQQEYPED